MVVACPPAVGNALPTSSFRSWILGSHPWLFCPYESTRACIFLCETLAPRPRGHRSRGEAQFPRASRPAPRTSSGSDCLATAAIVLHGLALPSRSLGRPSQAPLGCFMSHVCGFWTLAAVPAFSLTRRLVVSGHLWTNSALLIDRSAEPVESSLPCSWQTVAPLHAGTRLATSSCRAPRARSL